MSSNNVASANVIAVLLADGWHRIVRGSFHVGPLSFEADAGLGAPGFRFEEADVGGPHEPSVLAGPLGSIIAVRQVTPALRRLHEPDRAGVARNGERAGHPGRPQIHAWQTAAPG